MKPSSWFLPEIDWTSVLALTAGRRVVADSRQVQPGDVFLAFQGEYVDGRLYIADAILRGAGVILWESGDFAWQPEWTVPNLAIDALRAQAGIVAARLLGDPSQAMWTVGVTGTNGKTSCAHWLAQAFGLLGHKTALLGTIGYGFLPALREASHTTPDAVRLQQLLADYRQQGASHVCMEVSSHGLEQARGHGVALDIAVFTNLTRDHLDYHGTMEEYGAAKARLFDWEGLRCAVINADDPFGAAQIARLPAERVLSYGIDSGQVRATRIRLSLAGLELRLSTPQGEATIKSALLGRFNVYNLLACLAVLLASGIELNAACAVLGQIESASGRMQQLGGGDRPLVVVDYAHTPDALEKALTTLRDTMPVQGKLYCVFGCGGDRDRGKRPLMGKIATRIADFSIITSDNPRTESPQQIIADIVEGVREVIGDNEHHYCVDSDRYCAIAEAIELAQAGDVVLIAGKGHEAYQDIMGVKTTFSDVGIAQQLLLGKGAA